MNVLVVNAGSSSLKFTLFDMAHNHVAAKGLIERIGQDEPNLVFKKSDGQSLERPVDVANHDEALMVICQALIDDVWGPLNQLDEVDAIGHRVVHGGEAATDPIRITPDVKTIIRDCTPLAPLHNPANLGAIEACERAFPHVPNVAVFDTAFHQTMSPASFLFAVPYDLYDQHGIRKYGFHGTSHKFVMQATADYLGIPLTNAKLITCHLGNGCSITAIDGGKVLDTSMGMTPLTGLVMGTRCGDIDPGVIFHLLNSGMSGGDVDALLNKQSGLLAVAGIGSSDMRDIVAAAEAGNERAERAIDMFVHRLVSYIGAYFALLGGADAVVLTGGIGENSVCIRGRVLERLRGLGCILDSKANERIRGNGVVSTPESTLKAVVMPTDEELMIARETIKVLTSGPDGM
ncbi:MAG: acetate kinase [Lentisphaerae bacterium]|nr:acetate kinase [Lentisphaerota bacterium]MBT5606951.1 acetate kinase [Lentisphaerota bacterium]MBT7055104.1 acetate kinase [Lentisphaerota bacterium]MBT7842218.1 acetate kinase [Lentisphaerota bacterium]